MKPSRAIEQYFTEGRRRITAFAANEDYSLSVAFDNKETRLYPMEYSLFGVFTPLRDLPLFQSAFPDGEGHIAWDTSNDSASCSGNRIDLCTDSIYLDSLPARTDPNLQTRTAMEDL